MGKLVICVYAVILVVVVVGKDFTIIVVSKVALASAPPPNYSISNIHSGLPTYKLKVGQVRQVTEDRRKPREKMAREQESHVCWG